MKINCLGWYNRGNVGDEAFKLAHKELFPSCEAVYTSEELKPGVTILGGGDVIKSYYLNVIPPEHPYYALGVGLGYESETDLIGKNLKMGFFRNKKDVLLANGKGIPALYTPDLTFVIEAPLQSQSILSKLKMTTIKKTIGVFLSDCLNPTLGREMHGEASYGEFFKWELAKCLEYLQEWYEIIFIPMSHELYSYDVRIHADVLCRMGQVKNDKLIVKPFSAAETIKLISELDLVIGMKYHSIIFATLVGTPFVNIGLTRKTELFCEEEGLSKFSIPKYGFLKERFLQTVKEAEADGVEEELLQVTTNKKRQLKEVKSYIQEEWFKI